MRPGIEHELRFRVPPAKTVPAPYPEAPEFQVMPRREVEASFNYSPATTIEIDRNALLEWYTSLCKRGGSAPWVLSHEPRIRTVCRH